MSSTRGGSLIRLFAASVAVVWLLMAVSTPAFARADVLSPDQLVKQTTEDVLKILKEHQSELQQHPTRIYGLVEGLVVKHFDFKLMSRYVLAQNWRQANPAQRDRFVREFRRLLVQTYGYSLSQYSGQTVEFTGMQASPGTNRTMVKTVIKQPNGPDIPVNYRLHKTAEGWKVYDVILDGISLVQNYRSSFGDQIRRDGLESFLNQLQQRNAKNQSRG